MTDTIVDLSARRPSVHYTIRLTHHWNGSVEIWVEDISDDDRSRSAVGAVLARAAMQYDAMPEVDALHKLALGRIDKLMAATHGTPEASELEAWATAVQAFETTRFPKAWLASTHPKDGAG